MFAAVDDEVRSRQRSRFLATRPLLCCVALFIISLDFWHCIPVESGSKGLGRRRLAPCIGPMWLLRLATRLVQQQFSVDNLFTVVSLPDNIHCTTPNRPDQCTKCPLSVQRGALRLVLLSPEGVSLRDQSTLAFWHRRGGNVAKMPTCFASISVFLPHAGRSP